MSDILRKAVWRGLVVSAILLAFPLAWKFGLFLGDVTASPEIWMDPR